MNSYSELNKTYSAKLEEAGKENGLFWAFSNTQFAENKTPLLDGDKYVSIGAGGYMPKSNLTAYREATGKAWEDYQEALKSNPDLLIQGIRYELGNHECWYTGDIEPVVGIFSGLASEELIYSIYQKGNQ
jgi:hypothetical protein